MHNYHKQMLPNGHPVYFEKLEHSVVLKSKPANHSHNINSEDKENEKQHEHF